MEKTQRVVVGGVLIENDRMLILKRNPKEPILPGLWELPSGKVDFGENPNQALIREFNEETGLKIEIVLPFYVFDYIIERKGIFRHTVQVNYIVKRKQSGEVVLSSAHSEYKWIGLGDIQNTGIDDVLEELFELGMKINRLIKPG